MKLQLKLKISSVLVVIAVLFYTLSPHLVMASTYGSGKYADCSYGTCPGTAGKGFYDKYAWLIYLFVALLAISFATLMLVRRKKRK